MSNYAPMYEAPNSPPILLDIKGLGGILTGTRTKMKAEHECASLKEVLYFIYFHW